jgi:hypothetical protein
MAIGPSTLLLSVILNKSLRLNISDFQKLVDPNKLSLDTSTSTGTANASGFSHFLLTVGLHRPLSIPYRNKLECTSRSGTLHPISTSAGKAGAYATTLYIKAQKGRRETQIKPFFFQNYAIFCEK